MGKIPERPSDIFNDYSASWKTIFGDDVVSIILYGSGARGDFRPGTSDLNFLVVLTESGMQRLHAAYKIVQEWSQRSVALPLIVTEEYIKSSKDSFPVEFYNMKQHHQLVMGKNLLTEIEINKHDLRLQCEREIKGKLLHLRQAFFQTQKKKTELTKLLKSSLHTFLAIFPAILYCAGQDIPVHRQEILDRITETAGLDKPVFQRLWQIYSGEKSIGAFDKGTVIWQNYVNEIKKLAYFVDQLSV